MSAPSARQAELIRQWVADGLSGNQIYLALRSEGVGMRRQDVQRAIRREKGEAISPEKQRAGRKGGNKRKTWIVQVLASYGDIDFDASALGGVTDAAVGFYVAELDGATRQQAEDELKGWRDSVRELAMDLGGIGEVEGSGEVNASIHQVVAKTEDEARGIGEKQSGGQGIVASYVSRKAVKGARAEVAAYGLGVATGVYTAWSATRGGREAEQETGIYVDEVLAIVEKMKR